MQLESGVISAGLPLLWALYSLSSSGAWARDRLLQVGMWRQRYVNLGTWCGPIDWNLPELHQLECCEHPSTIQHPKDLASLVIPQSSPSSTVTETRQTDEINEPLSPTYRSHGGGRAAGLEACGSKPLQDGDESCSAADCQAHHRVLVYVLVSTLCRDLERRYLCEGELTRCRRILGGQPDTGEEPPQHRCRYPELHDHADGQAGAGRHCPFSRYRRVNTHR